MPNLSRETLEQFAICFLIVIVSASLTFGAIGVGQP